MTNPTEYDLLVQANKKLDNLIKPGNPPIHTGALLTALTGIQNSLNAILQNQSPTPEQIPVVSDVSPKNGSVNGGESFTVTGSNFTGALGVMVGTVAATNVVVGSDTSLTFTSPAQPADTLHVTVVDAAGTSAIGDADKVIFA